MSLSTVFAPFAKSSCSASFVVGREGVTWQPAPAEECTAAIHIWRGGTRLDYEGPRRSIIARRDCLETREGEESVIVTKRAECKGFSQGSRRRLLAWLGSLNREAMPTGVFVTLTYPESLRPKPEELKTVAKVHLSTFFKRLRRYQPQAWGLWRLEYYDDQGKYFPHFHLMVWGATSDVLDLQTAQYKRKNNFLDWRWVRFAWGEIIGQPGMPSSKDLLPPWSPVEGQEWQLMEWSDKVANVHESLKKYVVTEKRRPGWILRTEAKSMRSWNGTGHYISKYIAKPVQADEKMPAGRVWGIFNRAVVERERETFFVAPEGVATFKRFFRRLVKRDLVERAIKPTGKRSIWLYAGQFRDISRFLRDRVGEYWTSKTHGRKYVVDRAHVEPCASVFAFP